MKSSLSSPLSGVSDTGMDKHIWMSKFKQIFKQKHELDIPAATKNSELKNSHILK